MNKVIIAPSLLAADFLNLESEIIKLNNSNCQWIHLDVMDGHFVPNLTFGHDLIKSIKNKSNKKLDVHLMIENPTKYIEDYIKLDLELITIHFEIDEDIDGLIKLIKKNNIKVGLAIKPETKIEQIIDYLPKVDVVVVMSVHPGFGGQTYIESSTQKIKQLNQLKIMYNFLIEVDGGVNGNTFKEIKKAGADILVAGSYLFNTQMNQRIEILENE